MEGDGPAVAVRSEVTRLLIDVGKGSPEALNRLLPLVYEQLKSLARRHLSAERADHTLNATALVHEAYVKLVDQTRVRWQSRAHFMAVASQAMRRILVDYARTRKRAKRGGGKDVRVDLDDAAAIIADDRIDELLALNEALERLEAFNPEGAQVVAYRFFGELSYEDIAEVTGASVMTARRRWGAARAWLRTQLGGEPTTITE